MISDINSSSFKFFKLIPKDELKNYTLSYDIHIYTGKWKRLITNTLTPLVLTEEGRVWMSIGTISLSASKTSGNITMKKQGNSSFFEYLLESHNWEEKKEILLSNEEKKVLILSAQGYTMKDIADNICKSIDTVKAYKRSIFQKMGAQNITEALTFAQNHQLI